MKMNPNLKLLPLVTALCVLVFTTVSCRNVMLEQKLRNRNKRTAQESTFPEAYYVKANGDDDRNDGIAYSTPYKTLNKALNMAQASGGKTNRVIVIGELKSSDTISGGGHIVHSYSKTTVQKEIL